MYIPKDFKKSRTIAGMDYSFMHLKQLNKKRIRDKSQVYNYIESPSELYIRNGSLSQREPCTYVWLKNNYFDEDVPWSDILTDADFAVRST